MQRREAREESEGNKFRFWHVASLAAPAERVWDT